jgi:hypothetical protein
VPSSPRHWHIFLACRMPSQCQFSFSFFHSVLNVSKVSSSHA